MSEDNLDKIKYTVIKSRNRKKSIGFKMNRDGTFTVTVPWGTRDKEINEAVVSKKDWMLQCLGKYRETTRTASDEGYLNMEDIKELAGKALKYIPERVAYYAPKIGVSYGRITIRNQKSRWGSCSSKGNLNFNCLLMLAPPEVIDSVVVHELCHRKEMNHSDRFYAEVLKVCPDYYVHHKWLKENGPVLMKRMGL